MFLTAAWLSALSANPYGWLIAVLCWLAAAICLFFLAKSWEGGSLRKKLLCAVCAAALALGIYGPLALHSRYFDMFLNVEIETVEKLTLLDRCRLALFWRDRPSGELRRVTVLRPESGSRYMAYCPESEASAAAARTGERYDITCECYGLEEFGLRGGDTAVPVSFGWAAAKKHVTKPPSSVTN